MTIQSLNDVKAGKYELVAHRWDQITSEPGKPLDFTRHRQGDVIDLNVGDAKRLWAAGAIRKPGDDASTGGPATGPSVAPGSLDGSGSDSSSSAAPPVAKTAEEQAAAVLADPSAQSVKAVIAALEHGGNDVAAATKVLKVEQAGQKRPMLLKALEKILGDGSDSGDKGSGDGGQDGGDAS